MNSRIVLEWSTCSRRMQVGLQFSSSSSKVVQYMYECMVFIRILVSKFNYIENSTNQLKMINMHAYWICWWFEDNTWTHWYVFQVLVQMLEADIYSARNLQYRRSKLFKQDVDILALTLWKRCLRASIYMLEPTSWEVSPKTLCLGSLLLCWSRPPERSKCMVFI
jgi:hypothetical protein